MTITLKAASAHTGMSVVFLRRHLHDQHRPLPHYHVGRAIRVKLTDLDAWLELFRDHTAGEMDAFLAQFKLLQ